VVGANIEESTILTIMLENACQIQLAAVAGGGIGTQFDASSIERLHFNITRAEQYTVNFEYLKRKAYRNMARIPFTPA
jgi:L-fuculose-phosphate aldolase